MLLWVKSIYSQNCSFELVKSYFLKWFQSISSLQDSRGWDDSSSEVWESLHHRGAFAISNWGHHLADLGMYQLSFQSARHPSRTHVFLDQSIIFSWWNRHFSCSNHHEITMKSPVFPGFSYVFPWNITIFLWVSYGFPMISPFSYGFPDVSCGSQAQNPWIFPGLQRTTSTPKRCGARSRPRQRSRAARTLRALEVHGSHGGWPVDGREGMEKPQESHRKMVKS